jgi:hypothetical protein
MHASSPTRRPAEDSRMLVLVTVYFVCDSGAVDPANSGIVACPCWLMPSRCNTFSRVSS